MSLAAFSFSKAASKLAMDCEAEGATTNALSEVGVNEFTKNRYIASKRQPSMINLSMGLCTNDPNQKQLIYLHYAVATEFDS